MTLEKSDLRFNLRAWSLPDKLWLNPVYISVSFLDKYRIHSDIIVQQCTGLEDKNNVLIYEGDILCFRDDKNKKYLHGEVFWSKEYLTYLVKQYFGTEYMSDYLYELMLGYRYEDIVVAGNIFENPELLDNNKVL